MSRRPLTAVSLSVAAVLSTLLQACGGGSTEEPPASATRIRLEACVVDQHYIPHEGVPVRAVSADGRLLGHAVSGRSGEFSLQLPARAAATLVVDRDGGESISLPAQDRDAVLETCLMARDDDR